MIPKKFETNAVRTQVEKSQHDEHSVPLYLTSSFVFDDAEEMRASFADEKQRNIYSRFTNPNTNEFVDKICQMEGSADGCAFATGTAAIAIKTTPIPFSAPIWTTSLIKPIPKPSIRQPTKTTPPMRFPILFYSFSVFMI